MKEIEIETKEFFYDHHRITESHMIKGKNILHREDGPAHIDWYATPCDGIRHKSPFTKVFITDETYCVNGKQHRVDGPAQIAYNQHNNGKSMYYVHYCTNGKYHRLDGPARIWYETEYDVEDNETPDYNKIVRQEYYLCDIHVKKEDFETPGFIDAFILENS